VRYSALRPRLRTGRILAWADAHHRRTGAWPTAEAGPIEGAPGEGWKAIDQALREGLRGLPGGGSLAQLLAEHRGRRNIHGLPPLSHKKILRWADAHHRRAGQWPHSGSGPVVDAPGETWEQIDLALRLGLRGLPGGSALTRLLAAKRGARHRLALPPLTEGQILAWADRHFRETGSWPRHTSGPVAGAPGETWSMVHSALYRGRRGLPGNSSLRQLLADRRGVPYRGRRTRAKRPASVEGAGCLHHERVRGKV
jgi:hypothetical protein